MVPPSRINSFFDYFTTLSSGIEQNQRNDAELISISLKLKPESELNVKELRKLAKFYTDGRFAKQDNYETKKLNNLADFKENKPKADANYPTACYEVAKMYLEGRGTIKNVYKAKYYIDKRIKDTIRFDIYGVQL